MHESEPTSDRYHIVTNTESVIIGFIGGMIYGLLLVVISFGIVYIIKGELP